MIGRVVRTKWLLFHQTKLNRQLVVGILFLLSVRLDIHLMLLSLDFLVRLMGE